MSTGTNRLLDCPDWDHSDQYRSTKILCWHTLVDAMKKSVMCNDLRDLDSQKTVKLVIAPRRTTAANEVMRDLIESRTWLLGEIHQGTCSTAVGVGQHALKSILRGLWLRRDKYVCGTLRQARKDSEAALLRTRRERRKKVGKGRCGRIFGLDTLSLAKKALYTVKDSHKKIGIEL